MLNPAFWIRDQCIETDAEELQSQKERSEVAAADQYHGPEHRKEEQQVVFLASNIVLTEIAEGQDYDSGSGQQYESHIQYCELIDDDQRSDLARHFRIRDDKGQDRQIYGEESERGCKPVTSGGCYAEHNCNRRRGHHYKRQQSYEVVRDHLLPSVT